MFCQDWSLVKDEHTKITITPLKCRSWGCDECAPERKRQLRAQAFAGRPDKFITLTVNPARGSSPAERARELAHAFSLLVKCIRRLVKGREFEYLAVFEETKRGEPHLHVLARGPYIDQRWLSRQMDRLIGARIVHIKAVTDPGRAAAYVSKYIGKDPQRFATCKRYWSSRRWTAPWEPDAPETGRPTAPWELVRETMHALVLHLTIQGLCVVETDGDAWILAPPLQESW